MHSCSAILLAIAVVPITLQPSFHQTVQLKKMNSKKTKTKHWCTNWLHTVWIMDQSKAYSRLIRYIYDKQTQVKLSIMPHQNSEIKYQRDGSETKAIKSKQKSTVYAFMFKKLCCLHSHRQCQAVNVPYYRHHKSLSSYQQVTKDFQQHNITKY